MPKKKGICKCASSDLTLNNSANSPKLVTRLRKSSSVNAAVSSLDKVISDFDNFDIVEQMNADGSKQFVYQKKNNGAKTDHDIANRPGIEYPEIVFYLISAYIKPEQIASFARVNKAAYACTKRETFWRNLYKTYCHNHPRLPSSLRIEKSFKVYGLRQRIIRALHHTYDPFVWKLGQEALQDSQPQELVRHVCVSVWYCQGPIYGLVFLKFKKRLLQKSEVVDKVTKELRERERIDANPEEDCRVLQVTCETFREVPPIMGMTLTSVRVRLTEGLKYLKLHLGFSSRPYNISKHNVMERSVVLDTVVNTFVFDWWHPKYPDIDYKAPYPLHEWSPVTRFEFLRQTLKE